MQIYSFGREGQKPLLLESVSELPKHGFIWLDFTREEANSWPVHVEPLVEAELHDNHVQNSFVADHPSFFDVTDDYDTLIFQGLVPESCEPSRRNLIVTKSATFFVFDRLLVSVHADENLSFDIVKRKFCESKLRFPSTPVGLVYVIINTMVDRYLAITDELEKRLERLQDQLMDPQNAFEDWRELLHYRKQAHDLENLCEHNLDAVDAWRREMRAEITDKQSSRINDLREHIQRVQAHADAIQKDIEAAVQLHFASVSHQTNRVMRTLTVMSAIFFPLTLITGIYGMNFDHIPGKETFDGFWLLNGGLVAMAVGMVWAFKRRGYF